MEAFADYDSYDATGLAELVRDKEVHPAELVEAAIERIQRLNPYINAVIHPMFDRARELADAEPRRGPFAGVPFLLKDLHAAHAGEPFTGGSRAQANHIPEVDTELVRRYKEAGLIVVGKANTPEFGLAPVTEPDLHGPTRNPWDTSRTPGGSSGGSAAATAAGLVPMAHATDGGGSIRIPASACGLFGLKPSRGRSPFGPHYADGWLSLTEQHAVTRTVRDSARLLDATQGPDAGAPYATPGTARPFADEVGAEVGRLRVAVTTRPLLDTRPMEPDCVEAVERAADLLTELGHDVEEAHPALAVEEIVDSFVTMAAAGAAFDVEESAALAGAKPKAEDFELITWILHLIARRRSSAELIRAVHVTRGTGRTMAQFMEPYDVFLSATLARPPWAIGELDPARHEEVMLQAVRRVPARPLLDLLVKQLSGEILRPIPNTPLFNMSGQPAASVPLHWTADGLPVGVQLAARFGDDAVLFRLAAQLEEAHPWRERRPAVGTDRGSSLS